MESANIETLDTEHLDFIHDISFDHFGKRLATCSSDQTIKIWQKTASGRWVKACSFQAHDATIFKVKWAHPDHGSILASCSYDKTVVIWEEKKKSASLKNNQLSMVGEEDEHSVVFIQRIKLVDGKESIEDIKFAPKHLNLMIATASADGYLRIYEAPDLINLTQWKLTYEIQVNSLGINTISWNKNPYDPDMIIVGTKDAETSFMNKNVMRVQYLDKTEIKNDNVLAPVNEDKFLSIYFRKEKETRWNLFRELKTDACRHTSAVNDVSWSLLNGRSYHIIASCGNEGVFIWYVKFEEDGPKSIKDMDVLGCQIIKETLGIWKVSFNVMATLLAFSGQDRKVRICKCGYDKKWMIASEFEEEEGEEDRDRKGPFGEKKGLY